MLTIGKINEQDYNHFRNQLDATCSMNRPEKVQYLRSGNAEIIWEGNLRATGLVIRNQSLFNRYAMEILDFPIMTNFVIRDDVNDFSVTGIVLDEGADPEVFFYNAYAC
jgi:hypothetical protein